MKKIVLTGGGTAVSEENIRRYIEHQSKVY